MKAADKVRSLGRRHRRVRKKVVGAPERPRLSVYRSNRHIYAQVIDDFAGRTLASASSLGESADGGRKDVAKAVGLAVAARAKDAGVEQVVFDRGGFRFHGRVAAVAEGAREGGLEF
ncbi:MAG TPA: 50S ribosomal protein L18 [Actinomycetota bacterium]|nr:50S ribosomal protein L18 [Actinomycetota bacterium]